MRSRIAVVALLLGASALPAVVVASSASAVAAPALSAGAGAVTEVVQGSHLRLVSTADWEAAAHLLPGVPVRWDVEISATATEPGLIAIGLGAGGGAPLVVDVRLCMAAWRGEDCPGGAETLRSGWAVPRDGATIPLARTDAADTAHLRLDVTLDARGGEGTTVLRVQADGLGDSVKVGPGLPATGAAIPVAAIVAGSVLLVVGIGAVIAAGARRRRDRDRRDSDRRADQGERDGNGAVERPDGGEPG